MSRRLLPALLALLGVFATAPVTPVTAQCAPSLDASPGIPGFDLEVYALARFDSGQGEQLFAGGRFKQFGVASIRGLACWNGTTWEAVGTGVLGGPVPAVRALLAGDDGSGPSLFIGGDFSSIDGVATACVARFDGTQFHPLGAGLPAKVNSLALYDAGAGPRLYAGTDFTDSSVPGGIYRLDGETWSLVSGGMAAGGSGNAGDVSALAVYDAGNGASLYAGGRFQLAGGHPASYIARYDGAVWHDVGGGVDEPVLAMATFDDGHGPQLYCGGLFLHAGATATPAAHAARWNGQAWSNLGNPDFFAFFGLIGALETFDDGTGPALYLAGTNAFGPTPIFRFDGGPAWTPLPAFLAGTVFALRSLTSDAGSDLFLGGSITKVGAVPVGRAARYRGCVPPTATLTALTPPQLGTDLVLQGNSPGGAGRPYFCGFAFSANPGIQLPQGTLVPLAVDQLLFLSLDAGSALFDEQFGSLDAASTATIRLHLPLIPSASGLGIFAALIVFGAAEPDGIHAVSPALPLTLEL